MVNYRVISYCKLQVIFDDKLEGNFRGINMMMGVFGWLFGYSGVFDWLLLIGISIFFSFLFSLPSLISALL